MKLKSPKISLKRQERKRKTEEYNNTGEKSLNTFQPT